MKLKNKRNKYNNKSKSSLNWKFLSYAASGAIVVIVVYQCFILKNVEVKVKNSTIQEIKSDYSKVLALNKDIKKGDSITEEDLSEIFENTKLIPKVYLNDKSKLKNVVARINLSENTVLSEDMFTKVDDEITDTIKNQDFDWIKVHTFMKQDEYVDIHYKKKDGSDFIVASKKKVNHLNGSIFATNIDEEERMYINNATVEAALTKGILYTTIYPDAENQPKAIVTYKINENIKKLIEQNPNIIKESTEKIKNVENKEVIKKTTENEDKQGEKPEFVEGGNE